ncbi:hypothetical protein QJ850_gp223 [Acanthamoeba polyphaga mimivirus]|uniref:Uncharacterized protein n=1 Tax=Acanthamoeba polyphaga mimivirus Kroon TaxID=3069720 RepID=A0A0G2YBK5_9VIRU|nr:hypothetical protein QJ850_gp223 [Acanthamoeba polyphaga mimivirus]AKI80476.1 hypothetical protein [Acanthamoeba polyphaga mimivirus Kroon]
MICEIDERNNIRVINNSGIYHNINEAVCCMLDIILLYKFPKEYEPLNEPVKSNNQDIGVFEVEVNPDNTYIILSKIIINKRDLSMASLTLGEEITRKYFKLSNSRYNTISNISLELFGNNPTIQEIDDVCREFIDLSVGHFKNMIQTNQNIDNFELDMKELAKLFGPKKMHRLYYERLIQEKIIDNLTTQIRNLGYYCKFSIQEFKSINPFVEPRVYFSYIAPVKIIDSYLHIVEMNSMSLEEDESKLYVLKNFCKNNGIKEYSSIYKCLLSKINLY